LPGSGVAVGIALQEQGDRDVAGDIAEVEALPQRQAREMRAQQGGKDHEAQVDDQGREEDHPDRGAGGDQRQRGQLGGTCKRHQGHTAGLGDGEAALDHRHPDHHAPGADAEQGRKASLETFAPAARILGIRLGPPAAPDAAGSCRFPATLHFCNIEPSSAADG
jgi:hypothetical protein